VAAKEKELSEVHMKIRELERKEGELRAEKVVLPRVILLNSLSLYGEYMVNLKLKFIKETVIGEIFVHLNS